MKNGLFARSAWSRDEADGFIRDVFGEMVALLGRLGGSTE